MRSDAIKPGDVIAGKYCVRAIMGRSRGFLVDALHNDFDQRLAIRVLPPQMVDPRQVDGFRREAQTLAKLASEHVARILDVGTLPDGAFYVARQFLDGKDLVSTLQQRGALTLQEAVLYALEAAEAIAEAHTNGIVLRDLRPSHLFVTQRIGGQQIKIIDFGTAKLMRDAGPAAPAFSSYASPELVRKAPSVGARTDVWSLGVIFYEMLAGRPAFQGDGVHLMHAISREEPAPLSRVRAGLPAALDGVVAYALAKEPERRFPDVNAFAQALAPFGSGEAQALARRIAAIAGAARGGAPAPAIADPVPQARVPAYLAVADLPLDQDGVHTAFIEGDGPVANPAFSANVARPAAPAPDPEGSPLERTMFMGADYVAASPASPAAQAQRPVTMGETPKSPQRASQPATALRPGATMPLDPGIALPAPLKPASTLPLDPGIAMPPFTMGPQAAPNPGPAGPAPAAGLPKLVPAEPAQRELMPSHLAAMPVSGQGTIVRVGNSSSGGQKVALLAVLGAVVLLAVVAVLVVLRGRSASSATAEATSAVASAPAAALTATAATRPSAAPSAPAAAPTATATASAEPEEPAAPTARPAANVGRLSAPAKPEPAPEPPPANPDEGTLVAIAVGGVCAFTLNGVPKGNTSTLKLSLKPGSYLVTCTPSSGPSKSRSLTVTGGGTATAMFKL